MLPTREPSPNFVPFKLILLKWLSLKAKKVAVYRSFTFAAIRLLKTLAEEDCCVRQRHTMISIDGNRSLRWKWEKKNLLFAKKTWKKLKKKVNSPSSHASLKVISMKFFSHWCYKLVFLKLIIQRLPKVHKKTQSESLLCTLLCLELYNFKLPYLILCGVLSPWLVSIWHWPRGKKNPGKFHSSLNGQKQLRT